jgi:hypothetical protein
MNFGNELKKVKKIVYLQKVLKSILRPFALFKYKMLFSSRSS